jgi:hypothetical protein
MAYDDVLSQIPLTEKKQHKIMYLGDSENDNPAFRKADVSVGVKSDKRLNPILDCKYRTHLIHYSQALLMRCTKIAERFTCKFFPEVVQKILHCTRHEP